MKKLSFLLICFLLAAVYAGAATKLALYDDTHAQTAGNADWIPSGAYSEMVDTLSDNGFKVETLSKVSDSGDKGTFTPEILKSYDALILAEPNNPYSEAEQKAIVDFVGNGGGLFIIGDHGNADRNGNGWDAVKVFNTFCPKFGFKFNGDTLYEAPLQGKANSTHPVMFGIKAIGVWAGSTFSLVEAADGKAVSLLDSRFKKAPYLVAAEYGSGRVVAIGDSSPFDDGVGSGAHNKLHDSYDSFMFSHPQLAYNAMAWVTGNNPSKRVPSRPVAFYNEARAEEKMKNILIDAAHGNAASDKMETFERHMKKNGFKVFYTMNLIKPGMLDNFAVFIIPDPSLRFIDTEAKAISDWFMAGGNLIMGGSWDSSRLRGTASMNYILQNLGAVMRFNDDQVWDQTNKTNKPWGVLAHVLKQGHPVTKGVKTVITWGTCSLIDRNQQPLTEATGVEIIITGDNDTFNKSGKPAPKPGSEGSDNNKNKTVIYPKNIPIPIMGIEKIAKGTLVMIGCCNFTDYQYPDSDINMSQPGPPPFTHETPELYDNLIKFLTTTR